jgi:hypothetical protein
VLRNRLAGDDRAYRPPAGLGRRAMDAISCRRLRHPVARSLQALVRACRLGEACGATVPRGSELPMYLPCTCSGSARRRDDLLVCRDRPTKRRPRPGEREGEQLIGVIPSRHVFSPREDAQLLTARWRDSEPRVLAGRAHLSMKSMRTTSPAMSKSTSDATTSTSTPCA